MIKNKTLVLTILYLVFPLSMLSSESKGFTNGIIFYTNFEGSGTAHIEGNLGYKMELSGSYTEDGKYGKGYRFEPPYENLLAFSQSEPQPSFEGFTAGKDVNLTYIENGWKDIGAIKAEGVSGVTLKTVPVELKNVKAPYRNFKSFLASVYLSSDKKGTIVELKLLDEIDGTDWKTPVEDANKSILKKDEKAKVVPPVETTYRYEKIELSPEWKRVTAEITVDARRPVQKLFLEVTLISPEESEFKASAFQLEQINRYPDFKNFAGGWIPGGENRRSNRLSVPIEILRFNEKEGTMAAWFKLPRPEGGGSRQGVFMCLGGGWWQPVWYINTGRCYLGQPGILNVRNYKTGEGIIGVPSKGLSDGNWHHIATTWQEDKCILYIDGEEKGRARYYPAIPNPGYLLIGATTLEGTTGSAVMDESTIWNRALSPDEIKMLAEDNSGVSPLTSGLPTNLIQVPERLVFHRGEGSASIPLLGISTLNLSLNKWVELKLPELGLQSKLNVSDTSVSGVKIEPWKASPGIYQMSIRSEDRMIDSYFTVEIAPALPNPDFTIRSWSGWQQTKEYPFTVAQANISTLPSLVRSGLLADLRFDARTYHPLFPERMAESLKSAQQTAEKASSYPNIIACMLNTEVGIGPPPAERWFLDWMKEETGLGYIPEQVKTGPLRIAAGKDVAPVIPESDPAYRFAHWLRRRGKGWPILNSRLASVMKEEGLENTLFYTDQPDTTEDISGMEMVDYWHYPHVPSGLVTDFNRVVNIARLAGKKIMLTPGSIFWDPWAFNAEGKIICLPPDMMRQYLWITMAHPIEHMGFYGLGELDRGYVFEGTKEMIKKTLKELYPVGLLTGGLSSPLNKVAYLQTEGQLWMGPGDNQWIEWWFNRMTTRALAETGLRFDWIGDEHVMAGWLKNYDTVVMPGAWVVTEKIYDKLLEYIKDGGHLVVDRRCRAEFPSTEVLDIDDRQSKPEYIQILQNWAKEYMIKNPYPIRVNDGNRVWLYEKESGGARFIFLINNHFTSGELAGRYKVSANLGTRTGAPDDKAEQQDVLLTVPLSSGYIIYDVGGQKKVSVVSGKVTLSLPPAESALLVLLPEQIGTIKVAIPGVIRRGTEGTLNLKILTKKRRLIAHRDVIKIQGEYSDGTAVDIIQYHRVENGDLTIPIRVPLNARSGRLKITVEELISGIKDTLYVRIK
jgi:hypothetical protein